MVSKDVEHLKQNLETGIETAKGVDGDWAGGEMEVNMKDLVYLSRLRQDYSVTLKEIVRLESEIAKLKKHAHDVEERLIAADNDNPPPQLDKDGCVYWDSVLTKGAN